MVALHGYLLQPEHYWEREEYMRLHAVERQQAEVLLEINQQLQADVYVLQSVVGHPTWDPSIFTEAVHEAVIGERSSSAALDEVRPAVQARIDDMLDQ